MKKFLVFFVLLLIGASSSRAQLPDNLVVDGVPEIPASLREKATPYLEVRSAGFNSWHPQRREMLLTTRFADTTQLHLVKTPGGARRQLTFLAEPVAGGAFQPKDGHYLVFMRDVGGGEFYQLYRFDLDGGAVTLLTDGKSRNTGPRFSRSGRRLAYTSTRRTGKDTDIYLMNPAEPASDQLLQEMSGGGWSVADWSLDERKLLISEYVSINESHIHLLDLEARTLTRLTPPTGEKVAYLGARFARDDRAFFVMTDKGSEFRRLVRVDPETGAHTPLTAHIPWDVQEFELSPDGKTLAFITNEDGVGRLRLLNARTGKELRAPDLPLGIPSGLEWHENGRDLGFTFTSARSSADAYSLDVKNGKVERWTESETGGLDAGSFAEPELVRLESFDGLRISAFVYRPDATKFAGPRPAIILIHGGPESQSRPGFLGRNNYYLDQMAVALIVPNVRGSAGYGKTFLTLDNGFKREDSVKDIGAVIEWARRDRRFDGERIAVMGGSYGGYMVLASMVHFGDRLRCGVDVVGISNFVTFLTNTQDYRRDLRRAEYGDERDPQMRAFLDRISPANRANKLSKPLFVVQGLNDPRVPASESEQMVKAIRDHGGKVWYLVAKDEGHGFRKKRNADFQFLATIRFLEEFLVE